MDLENIDKMDPRPATPAQEESTPSEVVTQDERRGDVDHGVPGSIVCILGMHRSGTSVVTGSLQKAGMYLGSHFTRNPHNHRGNRENPEILVLHEDLLKSNGGSWRDPPDVVAWSNHHLDQAQALISKNAANGRWGFKDPRSLLTLHGWKRLTENIQVVGVFRNPLAVARSLGNRSGIPQEKAITLWNYYNMLLLEEFDKRPFPLICFDWEGDVLGKKIDEVAVSLGLPSIDQGDRFFTPDLRHHDDLTDDQLTGKSREIYRRLQDRAL